MTIALDATGVAGLADSGAGNHALTGSITVGTLTNGILVAQLNIYSASGAATGVRLDSSSGTSFTQLGTAVNDGGASDNAQLFYLLNPPSGSHSLYVEGPYVQGGAVMSSWSGVDQSTPFGTAATGTCPDLGSITLSPTSPTGGAVLDCFGNTWNDTTPTQDASQTSLGIAAGLSQGSSCKVSASYKAASGTVAMTWNASPNGVGITGAGIAVALQPASSSNTGSVAVKQTLAGSGTITVLSVTGTGSAAVKQTLAGTGTLNTITISDPFTDTTGTLLSAHVFPGGYRWVQDIVLGGPADLAINSNHVYCTGPANAVVYYHCTAFPTSADVTVRGVFVAPPGGTSQYVDLVARGQGGNVIGNRYYARWDVAASAWRIRKGIGGSDFTLGTSPDNTLGTTVNFVVHGSSLSLIVDGVTKISVTDTDIAVAGAIGLSIPLASGSGASSIPLFDTFEADCAGFTGAGGSGSLAMRETLAGTGSNRQFVTGTGSVAVHLPLAGTGSVPVTPAFPAWLTPMRGGFGGLGGGRR